MLEPDQHRRLQALSARRGESMASLVRESVARYLTDADSRDDPLTGIIGLFEDGGPRPHGPVAVEHDAYLADAIAEESVRRRPKTRRATGSRGSAASG